MPATYSVRFASAATQSYDTREAALAAVHSVYSAPVVEWFLDRDGDAHALVWASESLAANDDGSRACAKIVAVQWTKAELGWDVRAGHNWGRAVFQARTRAQLSKRALAKAIDCDPSYITHIEANRKTPSLDVLEKIAVACGVRVVEMAEIAEASVEAERLRAARRYLARHVGMINPLLGRWVVKGPDHVAAVRTVINDAVVRGEHSLAGAAGTDT